MTKILKLLTAAAVVAAATLALAEPGVAQVRHGGGHVGGHGGYHGGHNNVNMNVNRNVNRNVRVGGPGYHGGGVYHGAVGYHGGVYRGAWAGRPYRWAPGGAIAAGAAIGFIGYGAAVAFAPPPPQPGLCWYYTDPSQRNGFWDSCP